MKALWVDAGNDPDWTKVAQHRFTALFFPLSDRPADVRERLLEAKNRGYAVGVYMASNWPDYENETGRRTAELVDADVKELAYPHSLKVQFDMEEHDSEKIATCLERWRDLRPTTDTSWTLEAMQGGWMLFEFVQRVIKCKVRVAPQCYSGPMYPVDTLAAVRNLTHRGFPEALISPFYDAARLPLWWDGFAFTMGRLP